MPLLTDQQYQATFGDPKPQGSDAGPSFDFWPYFDAIPEADFEGFDCSGGAVDLVYRMGSNRFEHVLVNSDNHNVFMVLVLDREADAVYGHHLLNLNRLYGLE